VRNEDREEAQVEGDSSVTVEAVPPTHSATRSFSDSTVEPGTEFNVMIEAAGYGAVGQLVETLPAGFSYVSTTSSFEPNPSATPSPPPTRRAPTPSQAL
jgi:hypothetical protein